MKPRLVYLVATLLACAFPAFVAPGALAAPPPTTIEYHAFVTNSAGVALEGSYKVKLALYALASGGSPVWQETQPSVTITAGAFSTLMGSVTPIPPALFDGTPLWIETAISDTTLSPRRAIATVPYAFHSGLADTARALTLGGPSVFHFSDTRSGCPPIAPASGVIMSQTVNLGIAAPLTVDVTMARLAAGRRDLQLSVDGTTVQSAIASTAAADGTQWLTARIHWSGNLSAGLHTFNVVVDPNTAVWGCGQLYGAMDILVLR